MIRVEGNRAVRDWIAEVQILRGIAVLMVVAYHAALPYPGGFAGVDVFLVISGFVICRRLLREHRERGRISFRSFYVGRFRRLMPALAVLVAAVLVSSALLEDPASSQRRTTMTAASALVGAANVQFAVESNDYFAESAESNPLLHTWSLGVEEQFYLVLPLVVASVLARAGPLRTALAGIAAMPLLLSLAGVIGIERGLWDGGTWLGFFSPVGRLWEFGFGIAAAAIPVPEWVRRRAAGSRAAPVRATCYVAILASGALLTAENLIPGPVLLPAVSATAVLLWLSRVSDPSRGRVSRSLERVGDRSYSIYLWHWPFVVHATVAGEAEPVLVGLAALVSLLPAEASYRFLEPAGRRQADRAPITRGAWRLAALPLALAALSWSGVSTALLWGDDPSVWVQHPGDTGQDVFHHEISRRFVPCEPESLRRIALRHGDLVRCAQSRAGDPTVALVGDSHAEHLFPGLADALPDETLVYYIRGELPLRSSSREFAEILDEVVRTPTIHSVIVVAHWDGRGAPRGELTGMLRELRASGRTVFVTDDVPTFPFEARQCHRRTRILFPRVRCTMDREYHDVARRDWEWELTRAVADAGAILVPTADLLCTDEVCSMAREGRLLYRDYNHLNLNGSSFVAAGLADFIRSPQWSG